MGRPATNAMTQREIARRLGMTRGAVSMIEASAIRKLWLRQVWPSGHKRGPKTRGD